MANGIAEALNDPNLSEDNKNKIKEHFRQTYGVSYDAAGSIKTIDGTVSGFNTKADKNCTVTIGNTEYKVQNKGAVSPITAKYLTASFSGIDDGSLVTHNGEIYYRTGDKWYQLEVRGNETESQMDDWKALRKAVGITK